MPSDKSHKKTPKSKATKKGETGRVPLTMDQRLGVLEASTSAILTRLNDVFPQQPPIQPLPLATAAVPTPTAPILLIDPLNPASTMSKVRVATRSVTARAAPYTAPNLVGMTTQPNTTPLQPNVNNDVPLLVPDYDPSVVTPLIPVPIVNPTPSPFTAHLNLGQPALQPTTQPITQADLHAAFAASAHQAANLPTSFAQATDASVADKVQVLLSTASQISGIRGRHTHPHNYIFRGPAKIKTALNTLDLAEYLFGLFRLMYDPRTPHADRPFIATHIYQVVQDAKDYRWPQVREWSEEVLTLLADGLLSWQHNIAEIHDLRSEGSHARIGRIHPGFSISHAYEYRPTPPVNTAPPAAAAARQAQPTSKPNNNRRAPRSATAAGRTDVACPAYNTTKGCTKQDGHLESGTAHGHHCAWCRSALSCIHFHSESLCRLRADPNTRPYTPFQA